MHTLARAIAVALFSFANVSLAAPNKVEICHYPPGDPDNFHTISVSAQAAEAHLGNHPSDFLGACCEGVASCDDGNPCTLDRCAAGACTSEPVNCDDGDLCTVDSCDATDGCLNQPVDCSDADVCTADICDGLTGLCENPPVMGGPPQCTVSGGLIAYFPFDDPLAPFLDPVGGHVATPSGAAVATTSDAAPLPSNPGSLFLSGGFASVPDAPEFDFDSASPFTIALWFKASPFVSVAHLLGKRAGCGGGGINYQFARDGGLLHFNSGGGFRVNTGVDVVPETWMHFATTYDGAGNLHVYIDGIERAQRTGYTLGGPNTSALLFGNSGSCPSSQRHRGFLDEIRIYDRPLSAAEVAALAGL